MDTGVMVAASVGRVTGEGVTDGVVISCVDTGWVGAAGCVGTSEDSTDWHPTAKAKTMMHKLKRFTVEALLMCV